jgi:hypothetical protein
MGTTVGFPRRRLVVVAGSGDLGYKTDVAPILCWAAGCCAKLRTRRLDAPALTLTARSSPAALRDHLLRAGDAHRDPLEGTSAIHKSL